MGVARYADGSAMAVVGFELDQVMVTPEGEEFSLPINAAYNHHFESTMTGGSSVYEKIVLDGPRDPRIAEFGLGEMGHSMNLGKGTEHWVVRDLEPPSSMPTRQAFGAANGGEVRKSFHGYAPGFAQVIESPRKFQITPMQIDTWNREKMANLSSRPAFVAGPLPRNSLAPAGAAYSGLLECPVTTRIRKAIDGDYRAQLSSSCEAVIATAGECYNAASANLALPAHGVVVQNKSVSDSARAPGCSLESNGEGNIVTVLFNDDDASRVQCGEGVTARAGSTSSLVQLVVAVELVKQEVSISLTGPSDVWFGVGFNASAMADQPWAIIVDGTGEVSERKLVSQSPGTELPASVKVISNRVDAGLRTVVLSRALKGATVDHYSFSAKDPVILPFINAVGTGPNLSYHKDKTPSTLALLPVTSEGVTGACLCPESPKPFGKAQGTLSYNPVDQPGEQGHPTTIRFDNNCQPFPRMELLEQQNPTCDLRTYAGGQIACHHMFSLLDADQEIPWPDQPLEYQLKFRFWYQDYDASYHHQVKRTTWGIGSPVEYDVPKCEDGMHGCAHDETGDWIHTISGTYKATGSGAVNLVAAHFHCHAPTCKSVKMYRNWNGTHGDLLCEQVPIYGGTGKVPEKRYDEQGFILVPPCLWGSPEQGLEQPPDVTGQTLHTIKTSYANVGHHGEMAWQQMFYANSVPDFTQQWHV